MTRLYAAAAALATVIAAATLGAAYGTSIVDTIDVPGPTITATETATVTTPGPTVTVEVTRTPRASRQLSETRRSDNKTTGDYQDYARQLVTANQWPCLRDLWQRESGWNPRAVGAVVDGVRVVGIPQLRGLKVTDGWEYQIRRGLTYIDHRYGSPCAAWSAFQSKGWY